MLTYLKRTHDFCLSNSKRFILNRLQYRVILSDSFSTTYDYDKVDTGGMGDVLQTACGRRGMIKMIRCPTGCVHTTPDGFYDGTTTIPDQWGFCSHIRTVISARFL